MNEAEHRKLAQSITHSLELKGYRRDVPNNIFIKKCSDEYFDYNEIRFVKDTVLITNLHYRLIHSFNINDLIAKKGSKMAHNERRYTTCRINNETLSNYDRT